MATILLLAVLFGSMVAIILMVYLIDRVKRLEMISLQLNSSAGSAAPAPQAAENGFLGLSAKALWDAMCGKVPEGFNEADLVALKSRYEYVLQNHIETIFKLGKKDRKNGNNPETPKNPIDISTLRGTISSWIPAQHVSTLYKAGYESVEADEVNVSRLKADIDDSVNTLFTRTNLSVKHSFSDKLMDLTPTIALPSTESVDEMHEEPPTEF